MNNVFIVGEICGSKTNNSSLPAYWYINLKTVIIYMDGLLSPT
jgi:hypothetical protein